MNTPESAQPAATPLTDAALLSVESRDDGKPGVLIGPDPSGDVVYADFARQLERDLAQARAERDEADEKTNTIVRNGLDRMDALEAQNAALRASLAKAEQARDEAKKRADELAADIGGILEECGKHITLSNDFPWAEEVHCAFNSLRADLAELRRDREDLEWLDKNGRSVAHAIGYRGAPDQWHYKRGTDLVPAASLRKAIRSARRAHPAGDTEGGKT